MRLLIVDFLDSYSCNIPSFIRKAHHDAADFEIDIKPYTHLDKHSVESVAASYHGVILSAGPGTVESESDLGSFTPALLARRPAIPVYGICLGFQAICWHFGGTIHRLSSPHHGLISHLVSPDGVSLGRSATRYHSLEARLDAHARQQLEVVAIANNYDRVEDSSIMEVRHRNLPFWGVQYHPESIYSHGCEITAQPFLRAAWDYCGNQSADTNKFAQTKSNAPADAQCAPPVQVPIAWKSVACQADLLAMLPAIQRGSSDFVLLDSSSQGRWDILAAASTAYLFQYSVRSQRMSFAPINSDSKADQGRYTKSSATLADAWSFLKDHSSKIKYTAGPADVPFWGGFIGYFGYELGLAELGLDAYKPQPNGIPEYGDIQLLWSTETLLYDKSSQELYAISLNQDSSWTNLVLELAQSIQQHSQHPDTIPWTQQFKIDHPSAQSYIESIEAAQEEIKAGNSYELCLTAPSATRKIQSSSTDACSSDEPSPIQRFRHLRTVTPAKFMSLIQLGGVDMLSASPEEFLSYDTDSAIARMKPIKGTLPKKDADGKPITHEMACKSLHEPKCIAENLMIVDLVRHDLSQVSNRVTCPDLMHVKDIGPMYQLISTVQAEVRDDCTAWDLIRHSLPPGSMTGAPKRRSCEILQRLEQGYRGLYSGITGYIDVRGQCRTSVNIRNMVRYPGETHWRIGAGGAITSLSDPVDEWHERQLKSASVCRSLVPSFSLLETILWDPKVENLMYWDEHVWRLLSAVQHFGFEIPTFSKADSTSRTAAVPNCPASRSVNGDKLHADRDNPWKTTNGHGAYDNGITADAAMVVSNKNSESSTKSTAKVANQLYGFIMEAVHASESRHQQLRLSLATNVMGVPSLTIVPILPMQEMPRINIRLDPCATPVAPLEPFISYKTTNRAHYLAARDRAGVQGIDEVLMFRPDHQADGDEQSSALVGAGTDWLTEGSYTNVAFWDSKGDRWRTPDVGCLPGIMREKLLLDGEVDIGNVQRQDLPLGSRVRLFNSVRGVFEGIVS